MNLFLIILIISLVISLIHTFIIALIDCEKIDETLGLRLLGGPITWIIFILSFLLYKIETIKKKRK